ncbi:Ig-like domain-containing protein, partial [Aquabacterium sp. OR-4]|uniref:Ig-like domain-containing protein n=1 Tax=Aquabacterium sp. OR-4 TaxID=2978127 RepID=UPI0028C8F9AD
MAGRSYRIESLEPRLLLSADLSPTDFAGVAAYRNIDPIEAAPEVNPNGVTTMHALAASAEPIVTLSGPGSARLVIQANGYLLELQSTTAATEVSIASADGGRVALTGIRADSHVGTLSLAVADLSGNASFAGSLGTLNLGQVRRSSINVAGGGETTINASELTDAVVVSPAATLTVKAGAWVSTVAGSNSLQAAALKSLAITGDCTSDLLLSGAATGFTLGTVQVGGSLAGGVWSVHGRGNAISAGSTGADWRLNVSQPLTQLITRGQASGQVAVASLQLLQVGGDARDLRLMVGADLGDDAALGGSGANADSFKAGTLARVRITGSLADSQILVSVDPVDGVLGDGNDRQLGTVLQRVQEFIVGGQLLGSTTVVAPQFPSSVRVAGQAVSPASLPQLRSTPPDRLAPMLLRIGLAAASDTGDLGDGRTTASLVALEGEAEVGAMLTLRRAGESAALATLTVPSSGRFSLAGIALALGSNGFDLSLQDAAGNVTSGSLTLVREAIADTTPPSIEVSLAHDTGASASDGITRDPAVHGRVADNAGQPRLLARLDGQPGSPAIDLSHLLAADGSFTLDRAQLDTLAGGTLADGAHALQLQAQDAAGLLSEAVSVAFTLDTTAPVATFGIDPAHAIGNDDGQTYAATVDLLGSTEPGASIALTAQGLSTTADADGRFRLAGVALPLGSTSVQLDVVDKAGNRQTSSRSLQRLPLPDTQPPTLSALRLQDDTGASATDRITRLVAMLADSTDNTGVTQVFAAVDEGPTLNELIGSLGEGGVVTISRSQIEALAGGSLGDGAHSLRVQTADAAGNRSTESSLSFTLDTTAPIATLSLAEASDTAPVGDLQTEAGTVTIHGRTEAGAQVRLGSAQSVADAQGAFVFAAVPLALGANTLTVDITDVAGNTGTGSITVTRIASDLPDTSAPALSGLRLQQDTGASGSDRITRVPAVQGQVIDDRGATVLLAALGDAANPDWVDVSASLSADGSFTLGAAQLDTLAGGTLADGVHTLQLAARDAAGNTSATAQLSFTLDRQAPAAASIALASADSLDADGTQTAAAVALMRGSAEAGAVVSLPAQGLSTVAAANGSFQLPGVALAVGENLLQFSVTDAAGNSQGLSFTVTRVETTQTDAVLTWNDIALRAIQLDVTDPPVATRNLALVSLAQYDTLAAIEGTPAYLVQRSVSGAVNAQAAVAVAAHRILSLTYPAQKTVLDAALASSLASIADGAAKDAGITLGLSVADAVLAIRANDGSNAFTEYAGSTAVGQWRPTGPIFDVAENPHWASVTPFALSSPGEFRPSAPPTVDSAAYATALNEIKSLGSATSSTRTADQTQQAHFWADGKGSTTPPGHWNQIASQVALTKGNSLSANARLFAQLNVALADAAIACWDAKYFYGAWRPETAIHDAELDNNAATTDDDNWRSLLITPPHPDYVSGHSTFSAAAAAVLGNAFGDNTAFSTTSATLPGVTRSFSSFTQAAEEAGRSRVYGGIHFEYANQAGKALGQNVAQAVLQKFALAQDTQAPSIVLQASPTATNANLTFTGQVLDNLSGVAQASYRIDGGAEQALTLGTNGSFSITTALAIDGSADGLHTVTLIATDAAGNTSAATSRSFTLDTQAPSIELTSLADGATLAAGSRISGTANPNGGVLTQLSYTLDGGAAHTLIFDASSGSFDAALDFGSLAVGDHTVVLSARDAAGNTATLSRTVKVDTLAAFTLVSITPGDGSSDVGVTQRPIITFSRAVNAATLNASSLYATGPDGSRLATTLVPAADGTFAWLFFNDPMPGGSRITITVDGSKIRAAADGAFLDADGNGSAGGQAAVSFTTVSTTVVAGTTLKGKVVDPGVDLEPMTFDDMRRGPDGVIHTADDLFLNPIVHAKVYMLGQEDRYVYTDAEGNFTLTNLPAGEVKVAIDGRTATNAPSGVFWPEMVMAATLKPGVTNTLMDSMGSAEERLANTGRTEVYLPRVATSALQTVSNTQTTVITVDDPKAAPALTEQERSALTLTVAPGSAIGEDGKALSDVKIGIATVPPELVRDMLPPGVLQHTFDITIQAPGVATFAEPVQITFPNVFNAAPGSKLNILSFDHTTGMLVINGTGTVSADGLTVVSDPESGVKAPGWHGMTPPGGTDDPTPDPDAPAGDLDGDGIPDVTDDDDDGDGTPDEDDDDEEYLVSISLGAGITIEAPQFSIAVGLTLPDEVIRAVLGLDEDEEVDQPFAFDFATDFDDIFDNTNAPFSYTYTTRIDNDIWSSLVPENLTLTLFGVEVEAELSAAFGFEAEMDFTGGEAELELEEIRFRPGNIEVSVSADIDFGWLENIPYDIGEWFKEHSEWEPKEPFRLAGPPTIDLSDWGVDEYEVPLPFTPLIDYHGDIFAGARAAVSWGFSIAPSVTIRKTLVPAANATDRSRTSADLSMLAALESLASPSEFSTAVPVNQDGSAPTASRALSLMPDSDIYYYYQVSNGTDFRGTVERGQKLDQFLPPDTEFNLYLFDPVTNKTFVENRTSPASGANATRTLPMTHIGGFDADGDGLSDLAELVVGTRDSVGDTDRDGISDLLEIQQGLDPLGGLNLPTGVIAAAALQGSAEAVTVVATGNSSATALVATGTSGLALLDTSKFTEAKLLAQMALPGNSVDVAVDASRGLAAVAASEAGLHLIDISQPAAPVRTTTVSLGESVQRVVAVDGIAYAAHGSSISAINMQTGEVLQKLVLGQIGGGSITDMAVDGNMLYVMDANRVLRAVSIREGVLAAQGAITLDNGGGKLFVGGGVAYVGTLSTNSQGFLTVDVSDAANLRLLSGVDAANVAGQSLVANGSGLLVSAGQLTGPRGEAVYALDVSSVADPADTGRFLTRINLPAAPRDVVLANGMAFVADGSSGLQVVNYVGFDTKGQAPVVSIALTGADIDPDTAGTQVQEGSSLSVTPTVSDDVQLRSVELLANGQVVATDLSFPYDLLAQVPTIAAAGNTLTLQVRATDTGGNVGLSETVTVNVVPDTFAPEVRSVSLTDGASLFFVRSVDITFNEPIARDLFTTQAVSLVRAGADGLFDTADDTAMTVRIDTRAQGQVVSILPDGYLPPGQYRLRIDPTRVTDRVGNALGAAIQRSFVVRPASEVRAAQGAPEIAVAPSANPLQEIGVPVSFDPSTARMRFVVGSDSSTATSTQDVTVRRYDATRGLAYFVVPVNAVSGDVTVFSQVGSTQAFPADGSFPLQIVPVVTGVQIESVASDSNSAQVTLSGYGFAEGAGEYRFGSALVSDAAINAGADVYSSGQRVLLTLPLSDGAFGPITVKTAGGVSAAFSASLSGIESQAYSG